MNPAWTLNLDSACFLEHYWQRQPLLIRHAIDAFKPPIDGHDLAGLAMEEGIESRIVEKSEENWRLEHGPFTESAYQRSNPWTLLVQSVDHYIPAVEDLRRVVDFIPQWRVDDVMVSYAVDGGSVGPHYDNYDVFLLQGQGERLWQLGQSCDGSTSLLPHDDLRILDRFHVREEFLLQCGDMLYVPPGVAHWGIARGECTTFSIGFRAPRIADMVSRWVDQLLEHISAEEFYRDPGRTAAALSGEITTTDRRAAREQLQKALDSVIGEHWFGELVTEPRNEPPPVCRKAVARLKNTASQVECLSTARLAWQHEDRNVIQVYANGVSRPFAAALIPVIDRLCRGESVVIEDISLAEGPTTISALLEFLLENGVINVR